MRVNIDMINHETNESVSLHFRLINFFFPFTEPHKFFILFGFWQKMLDYLREKRDVGFFHSLASLMQSCRYCIYFSHVLKHISNSKPAS